MSIKNIIVSGYTGKVCKYLKKNLIKKYEFFDYKKTKKKKFYCFIHFAVINKVNPNIIQIKQEKQNLNKIIKICKKLKINKFILLSTFLKKKNFNSYEIMKMSLEEIIKKTNLDYAIIRPTKILNKFHFKIFFYINKINNFLCLKYKMKYPIFFESFQEKFTKILNQKKFNKKIYSIHSNLNYTLSDLKRIKNFQTLLNFYKIKITKNNYLYK